MQIRLIGALCLALFTLPVWAQSEIRLARYNRQPPPPPPPLDSPLDRQSAVAEEPTRAPAPAVMPTEGMTPAVPLSQYSAPGGCACDQGNQPYYGGENDINYSGCGGSCGGGDCGYGDAGCGDCGCDSQECCDCGPGLLDCCRVCPPCGFNFGVGFYFLKPHFQSNQAFGVQTVGQGPVQQNNVEFRNGYDISPLIWMGYTLGNGLGVRVRYWEYRQNSAVLVTPGAGQTIIGAQPLGIGTVATNVASTANSNLRLDVWDFEAVQNLPCNCWLWQLSGGLRYLHTRQRYDVVTGALDGNNDLTSAHRFRGVGPTIALRGQRALGASGIALFADTRLSVLVGDNSQAAAFTGNGNGAPAAQAFRSVWAPMFVSELELGASYTYCLGRVTMVGTAGLVGQYWSGLGNAAQTDQFSVPNNAGTANSSTDVALYGGRFTLSFWY